MKVEHRSSKRSHKLEGIRVGRIAILPFLPGCRSRKQKRKSQPFARPGIEHCDWFILPLPLATPTMQFSVGHKRRSHKWNWCSASDSVGLIFTRSYHSTLLITTPTMTPSLVKSPIPDQNTFAETTLIFDQIVKLCPSLPTKSDQHHSFLRPTHFMACTREYSHRERGGGGVHIWRSGILII